MIGVFGASLVIAIVLASSGTTSGSPDLVVVSSEAVQHSALFVQPDTSFAQPASELKHVSDLILKLFGIDATAGSLLERRPPRALLTVVIGGLAPQMLHDADFPNLNATVNSSPKSNIDVSPETRELDDMLKLAFTTNEMTLNGYVQTALQNRVQMKTRSLSESACNLFLGCESESGNLEELALVLNAKFDNLIMSFEGSNGHLFQLDTSIKSVNSFLREAAMILATSFSNSDLFSPSFTTVIFSTLQPVLNEHGIQSPVVSACFCIIDIVIPRVFKLFRTVYPERGEIALLLLPPSHGAYITDEVRQLIASVDGIHSYKAAFVELSDRTPNGIASVHKRLAADLPSHFQILSLANQTTNTTDPNPALFQITLWVSVMLAILVIISVGVLCCGETRKDTLLYSKITPSNDKKNR